MEEINSSILNMAIRGEKKAFESLYNHYAPFIWRLLLRMTGEQQVATELLQDTFIKVHGGLHKFKGDSSFSTWVYRIAHNVVLMNYRKNRINKKSEQFEDQFAGASNTDEFITKDFVAKLLSRLSVEDRFLLVAREIDGLSFDELAIICETSAGALRTRLHRIKENIKSRFSEPYPEKEAVA